MTVLRFKALEPAQACMGRQPTPEDLAEGREWYQFTGPVVYSTTARQTIRKTDLPDKRVLVVQVTKTKERADSPAIIHWGVMPGPMVEGQNVDELQRAGDKQMWQDMKAGGMRYLPGFLLTWDGSICSVDETESPPEAAKETTPERETFGTATGGGVLKQTVEIEGQTVWEQTTDFQSPGITPGSPGLSPATMGILLLLGLGLFALIASKGSR